VLRIVAALIFVQAGTMKLFAFPIGMPPSGGTASFPSQVWIGGFLEVVGVGAARSAAGPGPWSIDAWRRRGDLHMNSDDLDVSKHTI
jgi:hypothetical protein